MRAWRGVAAAAIGTGACVALVVEAAADEPRMELTWSAPAECPDEASVRAGVAQLLSGSSAKVEGRAEVRRSGERWQVVLTMNGGERRLEADSCRALADATSLIVAMAVDPARVVANRSTRDAEAADANLAAPVAALADASPDAVPAPTPDAAPPPPASPPPLSPIAPPAATMPPPASPAAPALPRELGISAAVTTDVGTLPTGSFGPSVGFAWIPWPLRLELAIAYFPSSSASVPPNPNFAPPTGSHVQFSLLSASARACYQARLSVFDLGPCAGFEAGLLQGNPQGFDAPAPGGSAPLFALDAGLLGAWRVVPRLALFARADGLLQTYRPSFDVNGASLHQPGLVSGRGSLGVELRF